MLDKSIPYFNIIMRRPMGKSIPKTLLPKGYSFVWFTEGKDLKWAEIETSVGEFENIEEGLRYFQTEYLPYSDQLKRRLLFIQNVEGEEVGTITGWWNITGNRRDPSIHWFAVKKQFQGMGLGKALVSECLNRLCYLEGDKDVFLHTQTWSYKAVGLYLKFGFKMVENGSFAHYKNDYDQAIPILKKVLNK